MVKLKGCKLHDIRKQTVSLNTNYHQFTAYLFPEVKLLLLDIGGHPAVLTVARGHDSAANAGLSQMESSPRTLIAEGQRNWL